MGEGRLGLDADIVAVEPAGPLRGSVTAPSSKSVTNRLLVMAALAEATSEIASPLLSDDTEAMAAGLTALGAPVRLGSNEALVTGAGGSFARPDGPVTAGLSGTTLRFLAALSLLAKGPVVLDGEEQLRRRPLGPLLAALERAGATVEATGGRPPVTIAGRGLEGGELRIDAAQSSQFATALLLVAPYAKSDVELVVENLGAAGYIDLTIELMRKQGARVEQLGKRRFGVSAGRHYRPGRTVAEYDASAAGHLFSLALATRGSVTVGNVTVTAQPDAGLVELLEEMGATVRRGPFGTTVSSDQELGPIDADLSAMPDQLPTLAALAVLAPGESRFSGISVSRGHESDRPAVLATELGKLGAEVRLEQGRLVVRGGRPLRGALVDAHGDHRMAMALSTLGVAVGGVRILGPGSVAKTYPGWWEALATLGAGVRPEPG